MAAKQDHAKTKAELVAELEALRQRVAELEAQTVRDITGRKQSEVELEESYRFSKAIVDTAPYLIYIYDLAERRNLYANHQLSTLLGYTESAFRKMGGRIAQLAPPEDYQKLAAHFDCLAADRDDTVHEVEYRLRRADGRWCWLQSRDVVFKRTPEGLPIQLLGTAVDITEHKKAEEALRESEQRFRQLAENIKEIFWLSAPDKSQFFYVSPAYEEIWGQTCESLYQNPRSFLTHIEPADHETINQHLSKQARGEYTEVEYRIVRPDGSIRWVRTRAFPVYDDYGTVYRVAGISEDITERKRIETALQQAEAREQLRQQQLIQTERMASLGVLATGVAHEINNPNNYIMLNARILSKVWRELAPILNHYYEGEGDFMLSGIPYSQAYEQISQLIGGMSEGGKRIKQIVERLRNYATQDAEQAHQPVELNAVVKSAILMTSNELDKSTQQFSVTYGDRLPKIKGDPQQLEQVIVNLIINACQALSNKKQRIAISTASDAAADCVCVTISDEGVGISAENMKHVMEPFFTTKQGIGGTGLGLSVSYGIVKAHGGDLEITSELGVGTMVTVRLPVAERQL